MKEMNNIEVIKEKYWAGETTLAEEKALREYYQKNPDEQGPEQSILAFFEQERSLKFEGTVKLPQTWVHKFTHYILPLAASVILLVGALWGVDNFSKKPSNEIIVSDPQVALQITREAFALINGKVGESEQTVRDKIQLIDKTLIFKNL